MKKLFTLALVLPVCLVAGAVLAQQPSPPKTAASGQVCLQYNRLERWSVVNQRTLEITDKTLKKFRVAMNGTCAHSSFVDQVFIQRLGKSGLDCVEPGDRINLKERTQPIERCLVTDVSLYTDAQRKIDEKTNPAKP